MTNTIFKRVAVIGGGPSGMAQVKALNGEKGQFEIDLYESRSVLGGIWNYLPTKANYATDKDSAKQFDYSPMYNKLETNILHKAMEFTDVHFPEASDDFPFRTEVLKYLQKYASTIGNHSLYLNTRVTSLVKNDCWELTSVNVLSGETCTKMYDAIAVANGHFEVPNYPQVDGLDAWKQKLPSTITHAKFFDTPDRYKDKTVLVIGGYASGSDITLQTSSVAKKVYVSCDQKSVLSSVENPYIEMIPRLHSYDVENKAVKYGDTVVSGIDEIIFCTGYKYDLPFLKLDICKEKYISDLYLHLFYIADPSLIFIGLCKDVSPFPVAEAQSALTARYFSGRLKLPPKDEMQAEFEKDLEAKGAAFHSLKFPLEGEYINHIHDIIVQQGLIDGFMFDKYEGEKLERKMKTPENKLKRVIAGNKSILEKRLAESV